MKSIVQLCWFFLLLIPSLVFAQRSAIDSLKTLVANAKGRSVIDYSLKLVKAYQYFSPEEARLATLDALERAQGMNYKEGEAWVYLQLCSVYESIDRKEEAFEACGKAQRLFEELGNDNGRAQSLNQIGRVYCFQSEFEKSRSLLEESLEIQKKLGNELEIAKVYQNIGVSYYIQSNYDAAIEVHKKSLAIREKYDDQDAIAYSLYSLGICYDGKKDYDAALDHIFKSLKISEAIGDEYGMANSLNSIGVLHEEHHQFDKAISYYLRSLAMYEKQGRKRGVGIVYNNLGVLYYDTGRYEEALEAHLNSLAIRESLNDKQGMGQSLSNIGEVYEYRKNYELALSYYQQALALREEIGSRSVSKNYQTVGLMYARLGQYAKAEEFIQRAIKANIEKKNFVGLRNTYTSLSTLYEETGEFEKSLEAFKMAYANQDSFINQQNQERLAELESQYQISNKEKELSLLKKQREVDALWRYLLLGGLLAFLLAAFFIFRIQRLKAIRNRQQFEAEQALTRQLKEVDQVKSRFFTNISHEFRTPITIISGMIDQVRENPQRWLEDGSNLIKRNSMSLLNLVNQILDLRKLETGNLKLHLIQDDVVKYLRYVVGAFDSLAASKDIRVHFLTDLKTLEMDYDPEKLWRIVSNLLSNAFKFSEAGENVYFQVDRVINEKKPYLQFKVKDLGQGIPADKLPNIFDRFYQVDDSVTRKGEGTGIGLALTKDLIQLMEGEISVESVWEEGTTFCVWLPIRHEAPEVIAPLDTLKSHSPFQVATAFTPSEKSMYTTVLEDQFPALLIIEDNADVVEYLKSCLEDKYRISTASDGEEGLKTALEIMPDVIISDVMMPKMNGYECCHRLKTDKRTSHIPVILLTAKADETGRIEGLQKGADAYLTKPFNKEELFIRLEKVLELRQILRERYQGASHVQDKHNGQYSMEDEFILKVREVVENNIDDPEFGISQLCRELGMGRTQLHHKIKALTGRSTSIYIRLIRLQAAQKLLQTTDKNISEIAYDVGFRDPNYFSRTYAEEFGESPSRTRN